MKVSYWFIACSAILYVATFLPSVWLASLASLSAFILFIYSLMHSWKTITGMLTVLLIVIFGIANYSRLDVFTFMTMFQRNADVVLILVWSSLFGVPIVAGGFPEKFRELMNQVGSRVKHVILYMMTHWFGTILTVGALRIVFDLNRVSDHVKREEGNMVLMLQAFSSCVLWSPFISFLVMVLSLNQLDWMEFFPYGMVMAVAFTLIVIVIQVWRTYRKNKPREESGSLRSAFTAIRSYFKSSASFFLIWGAVFLEIFILSTYFSLPVAKLIILNCVIIPLLWALKYLPWRQAFKACVHKLDITPYYQSIVLFIGSGVIAGLILQLDFEWLSRAMDLFQQNRYYPSLIMIILFAIILIPSFYGIHPIVIISIASSLNVVHGWIDPLALAILCISTIPVFNLSSFFSVQNQLLLSLFGKNVMMDLVRHHRLLAVCWTMTAILFSMWLV